jgi:hypothetical protein
MDQPHDYQFAEFIGATMFHGACMGSADELLHCIQVMREGLAVLEARYARRLGAERPVSAERQRAARKLASAATQGAKRGRKPRAEAPASAASQPADDDAALFNLNPADPLPAAARQ